MKSPFLSKRIFLFHLLMLISCTGFANAELFKQARRLQHDGKSALSYIFSHLHKKTSGSQL